MWRVTQWLAVLWPHKWLYSWRRARHAMREFEAEYAPLEFIGSMDLEAERTFPGWWPAPPVDPEPWRVQTAADLAPEALGPGTPMLVTGDLLGDPREVVLRDAGGWISGPCIDPGPGEAPSDPGPDQDGEGGPLGGAWVETAALPPHSDLGPGARAVLARYERRFHELWACPWLDLGGLT